jgi:hypothetical protein
MSALERSRRLVTTFVALILYSTSAWRLRQLNRLMNPKKKKKKRVSSTGHIPVTRLGSSATHVLVTRLNRLIKM